jgi:N-acetylglutamate synthase-like GNAT family acetyltransferase
VAVISATFASEDPVVNEWMGPGWTRAWPLQQSALVDNDGLLEEIESYYDAVPRPGADAEDLGPFTLFVSRGGWPYYARPRRGYAGPAATVPDVLQVRARQRERGLPESFEWVDEVVPGLVEVVERAGLPVERLPLMAQIGPVAAVPVSGARVRIVAPEDPDLARIMATVSLGFGSPGTEIGPIGPSDRDAAAAGETGVERLRERLRSGLTVTAVALDENGPVAAGSHQPIAGVTEIVGVATLPAVRRRGLGALVTAALVDDARAGGARTVFLSAGSDDVARVYEKVGFARVATACIAQP